MAEAARSGRAEDERWHLRKDGSRFWGSGIMNGVRDASGAIRGFVKILREETARRLAEEARDTARSAAEEANRAKDEFLATLSHELRTPLSAVLLWSKILDDALAGGGTVDARQLSEGLAAIRTSAEAQKELIEDLLDVSQISSGTLRLQMRDLELRTVVGGAVETIQPTADNKGVTVEVVGDEEIAVRGDAARLRQVVWNLLANAVKFTPSGGRVTVTLGREGGMVLLRVADNGRGIDASFLPYVFERFRQADASPTRTEGGVGLGLAIAKQLVELHGGEITAESPGRNQGATFTVRLPTVKPRGAPR
jgi:signal transduction histidine kinase